MIRTTNCVLFKMKPYTSYMYKSAYILPAIHVSDMLVPLEYTFRSNYNSNGNMYSSIIEIKYIRERR